MMSLAQSWYFFFFFFSSRRRHTRYWRDWSSDVCSSDLRVEVDEGEHTVDEGRPDVRLLDATGAAWLAESPQSAIADLGEARLAADRQRPLADDLHPRVLLGVVRGRDRDPPVEPEVADGEIEHLRPDEADVEDLRAGVHRTALRRRRHRRRREPHVPPDGDPLRGELLDVGSTDSVRPLLVQLGRINPTDVVGLENLGVEHGGMLREPF